MNTFKISCYIFLLTVLFACRPTPNAPKIIKEGISFQLLAFDDVVQPPTLKDYVNASMLVYNGDSLLFNRFYDPVYKIEGELFATIFHELEAGDSALFIVEPYWIKQQFTEVNLPIVTDESLHIYVKVQKYFSEKEVEHYIKSYDEELAEQQYIQWYINRFMVGDVIKKNGVYLQKLTTTTANHPKYGDFIRIKLRGKFLNNLPLEQNDELIVMDFEYGTPNQVVPGIEKAIKMMKFGEKAKIILPSQLAFGKHGSSTGIVPPNTPLLYELELIKIKN